MNRILFDTSVYERLIYEPEILAKIKEHYKEKFIIYGCSTIRNELKKNYECNRPSWYAINLATAFLNSGSLLASFISLINLSQGFVFITLNSGVRLFKTFEVKNE